MSLPTFIHAAGPVHTAVVALGARQDGPCDGLLIFTGERPDPLPSVVLGRLLQHVRNGDRLLLVAQSKGQLAWARAQLAMLTAPGGRA